MNSESSKTSFPLRLLINLSDKQDLKRSDKYVARKIVKKTINLKYQLQPEMKNLNYHMDHILYQIFIIILSISSKKHKTATDSPLRIYANKIEKRIPFRIKARYYLEILTPEMMKLLQSTRSKITKNENDENMAHLKIAELVLVLCKIVSNNYEHNSVVLCKFITKNSLINCHISHLKMSYF